jgi:hypothetical protein
LHPDRAKGKRQEKTLLEDARKAPEPAFDTPIEFEHLDLHMQKAKVKRCAHIDFQSDVCVDFDDLRVCTLFFAVGRLFQNLICVNTLALERRTFVATSTERERGRTMNKVKVGLDVD